jgi:hypothetical protein
VPIATALGLAAGAAALVAFLTFFRASRVASTQEEIEELDRAA